MRSPLAALALALLVGCVDVQTPDVDAEPVDFDFMGEACTNAPDTATGEPVLTQCHQDVGTGRYTGWCVAGTCRPSCASAEVMCEAGTPVYDRRFGCYCSPE